MQRVLICDYHGGFSLSRAAFHRLRHLGQPEALAEPDYGELYSDGSGPRTAFPWESFCSDVPRDDPLLLQVFDEMGQGAAGHVCHLAVVSVPDGVAWHIEEYDGYEWVAEDHRVWPATPSEETT